MKEEKDLQLSIIVPVYNVEEYVRTCLESIFKQGLAEDSFEVIIVNDCTKDRSMEVIQDIINKHDNIKVITQENQGPAAARNNGILRANGEYIIMTDADDILMEDSIKPLLKKALETKVDLIVADFITMDKDDIGNKISIPQPVEYMFMTGEELYLNELVPYETYLWRVIYRKEFLQINNITLVPNIIYEDIPFIHECYLKAKKCIRTNQIMYCHRMGRPSVSAPSTISFKKITDYCVALAQTWKLRNIEGLSPKIRKRHMDYVYTGFNSILYKTLYVIEGTNQKASIIKELRQYAPDLKFTNCVKQIASSIMLWYAPKLYVQLLLLRKKIFARMSQT